MPLATARAPRPTTPAPPADRPLAHLLPAPAWRHWHDVLAPCSDGSWVPVDTVVLGPTGVHVVVHQGAGPGPGTTEAAAAADAVRTALPGRYRHVVTAALLVGGAGDPDPVGMLEGDVVVASTPVLVEAIRTKPRVLSRSETGVVAAMLARDLAPRVPDVPHRGWWARLTRRPRPSQRRPARTARPARAARAA